MPRRPKAQPDYHRFGVAIRLGREQVLKLRQVDCADRISVAPFTWRKVEAGDRVSSNMLYRAGQLMGWTPDDVDAILAGGDAPDVVLTDVVDSDRNRLARLERRLNDLTKQVAALADALEGQPLHENSGRG